MVLAYVLLRHYLAQQIAASLIPLVLNIEQEKITEVNCIHFSNLPYW